MYKIIGGDKNEYGPISAEQIRQWVAEGRANGQTLVQAEGTADWRPLSEFPELVSAPASTPPAQPATPSGESRARRNPLEEDYELDIMSCIQRGWELVKENFLLAVLVNLLVIVISGVINQIVSQFTSAAVNQMVSEQRLIPQDVTLIVVVSILTAPIYSLLHGGLYWFFLKLVRNQSPNVGDVFAGFGRPTLQLVLAGWVMGLLTSLGFMACVIPGIYLAVAWVFTIPLIMDREMSFWDAMEFGRKAVTKRWLMVFCLLLLNGLIGIAGVLACCVGILVAYPVAMAAMMYAYEDIFGG